MKNRRPLVGLTGALSLAFLLNSPPLAGQEDKPLFASHDVLNVRIEAPLTTLMRERPDEEYLDGTFAIVADDGSEQSFDLKLRTRGKFRREKRTCGFAPVRLNFRRKQVEGSVLAGQDKLKLVTHCQTRRSRYEQLVLREFVTYRILQELTDKSFGARLMRITWVDTEKDDPFERWGFVIEDEDDIGARIGLTRLASSGLNYADLDPVHTNMIMLYQYLVGNTDFSLIRGPEQNKCCHNATPFSDGGPAMSIPYDFDHAGLVNAPYAEPNPQFNIRSVRIRVYRGRCSNNDILGDTIAYFQSKRADIMAVVDEVPLDDNNRKQVVGYLDDFFDVIGDPALIERRFIRECS